jgi:hypothetical protein
MRISAASTRAWRWVLVVFLLGLAGCATSKINWSSRVGAYTYDQAVLELGPPDKEARVSDGTLVADWLTHRGTTQIYSLFPYGYASCYYGPVYPPYISTYSTPDYFLRLVFGPDGQLASWKKYTR